MRMWLFVRNSKNHSVEWESGYSEQWVCCPDWTAGIAGPSLWVLGCSFFSSLFCVPAPVLWIQCRQPWAACDEGVSRVGDMGEFEMVDRLHCCGWAERADLDEPAVALLTCIHSGKSNAVTGVRVWSESRRELVVLRGSQRVNRSGGIQVGKGNLGANLF